MLTMTLLYTIVPIILCAIYCFLFRHSKREIAKNLLVLVVFMILRAIDVYFMLPSRNLLSITFSNAFWGLVYGIVCYPYEDLDTDVEPTVKDERTVILAFGVVGVLLLAGVVGEVHSVVSVKPTWKSISKEYSKSSEAPTFKRNETPIALTPTTVLNRVHKSASDIPNSQYYEVSKNVQAQYYKGKPVYIVPVEYSGFWAMQKAKGIPGYFIIDATSQSASPKFVKKPYKYATSAYFGKDVMRQIYRHDPSWLTMSKPQLEIDDNGTPYWVQTVYKSEAFSHKVNYQKLHVVVMNAETGRSKTYSLKSLPKFIDEGITSDAASDLNKTFGRDQHGFLNRYFGKTGVIKPTNNGPEDGVTSIFNRDGSISYFTDFTNPSSSADSAMGYSMINARTGKITYYKAQGIMDSTGAKHNANQNYQAQQWKAKMPILYNINGRPTWVMTILDKTDAVRGYYYLDAQDQSIYGTGSNPTSALDDFRQALVNNGASVKNTAGTKSKKINGTVNRSVVVASKNKVMFTLQGSNTVYTVNTNDYDKANLIRPGDNLQFKASVVKGQSIGNVESFKNNSLK